MSTDENRSQRKIKQGLKLTVSISIIVLFIITNPTLSSYTVWLDQFMVAHTSPFVSAIANVFSGPLQSLIAHNTVRNNWFLFSIYQTQLMGQTITVLGVLEHFIRLSH